MDLYEESCVPTNFEGHALLTSFEYLFRFWFQLVNREAGSLQGGFQKLDISNVTRIVTIAVDNFLNLQELLNKETNDILSKKLLHISLDSVIIASEFVMKLFARNRLNPSIHEIEQVTAKQKLEEVIKKTGYITSKPMNYRRPVQHIIIETYITNRFHYDMTLDNEICRMLLDSIQDLEAVDHEGNTLLLFAAATLTKDHYHFTSRTLNLINSLIHRGAYVYAINNEGKAVIDYMTNFVMANEDNEEGLSLLEMLKSEVPPLQTLAAIKGKTVRHHLRIPDNLKQFIELH